MTQEQLADAVGLTAVHVNRTLQHLESEKLITVTNGLSELRTGNGLQMLATSMPHTFT